MGLFDIFFKGTKKEKTACSANTETATNTEGLQKEDMRILKGTDIEKFCDIPYGNNGTDNLLDIYVPKNSESSMPAIISVHGGAWSMCDKEQYRPYCMDLAKRNFAVININYRLAPRHHFPAPEEDLNEVLRFIEQKGNEYRIDKNCLFIVGDSAGAQIVSHYMTIFTNPEFAGKFGFELPSVNVRALGLNCGPYDTKKLLLEKDETYLYYLGIKKKQITEETLVLSDAMSYINSSYPPCYLASAVNDFLLSHTEPMYNKLCENSVEARMKIYGSKARKDIAHVFHLNVNGDEAVMCNDDECLFFRNHI